jgi:hypothetical protein
MQCWQLQVLVRELSIIRAQGYYLKVGNVRVQHHHAGDEQMANVFAIASLLGHTHRQLYIERSGGVQDCL